MEYIQQPPRLSHSSKRQDLQHRTLQCNGCIERLGVVPERRIRIGAPTTPDRTQASMTAHRDGWGLELVDHHLWLGHRGLSFLGVKCNDGGVLDDREFLDELGDLRSRLR